jgi:hypothetical protein
MGVNTETEGGRGGAQREADATCEQQTRSFTAQKRHASDQAIRQQ